MKQHAAPAAHRGRAVFEDAFPPKFVRYAYTLAIRRAARDAHRSACDWDAVECEICREHARAIADAKWVLNHAVDPV
ncbi:MAG: hypothetical protein GIW96_02045 [Candidatus Eremiobacteraeota bacterium]|nr:hypothetical protein [Candidatus Eremiobacteraeota bacterium]